MTAFICNHCKYRFESQRDQKDRNCPYCGRKEIGKERTAEELLDECE